MTAPTISHPGVERARGLGALAMLFAAACLFAGCSSDSAGTVAAETDGGDIGRRGDGGIRGDADRGDARVVDDGIGAAGPRVTHVEPSPVSARGGTIQLFGAGLSDVRTAVLDGLDLPLLEATDDSVRLTLPPTTAGARTVSLLDGAGRALVDVSLEIEPLQLSYRTAPAFWAPPPKAAVNDALLATGERSSRSATVLVATERGLEELGADDAGRLAWTEAPSPDSRPLDPVGHLARLSDTGLIWGCISSDASSVVIDGTGLDTRSIQARPIGPGGPCIAAAAGDFDGDGDQDVAELIDQGDGRVGLRLWESAEAGFSHVAALEQAFEPEPIGTVDPAVDEIAAERTAGAGRDGTAAALLRWDAATEVRSIEWELAVDGTVEAGERAGAWVSSSLLDIDVAGLELAVVTDAGTRLPLESTGDRVDRWSLVLEPARAEGEERTGSMTVVGLVVSIEQPAEGEAGSLLVDSLVAGRSGEGSTLRARVMDGFDVGMSALAWDGTAAAITAANLDGDRADELAVAAGEELFIVDVVTGPSGLDATQRPLGRFGPFSALAAADLNADGHVDLIAVGPDQDRLWIGDGSGAFSEDTTASMPVDFAVGADLAVADVDRDGAPDLLIANAPQSDRLYQNRGDGRFVDRTPSFGFDDGSSTAILAADVDGDGDEDAITLGRDFVLLRVLRNSGEGR